MMLQAHFPVWVGAEWIHLALDGNLLPPPRNRRASYNPSSQPLLRGSMIPARRILSGDENRQGQLRDGFPGFSAASWLDWLYCCRTAASASTTRTASATIQRSNQKRYHLLSSSRPFFIPNW